MKISVRFSFFYYKSKVNKDGRAPIFIKLSDKNEAISFSTSLYIAEKTWDNKKNKVKGNNDSIHAIN